MNISIIIPAYQSEKYIARAIRSALDQSMPKDLYEIIVIDDGSIDRTSSILNSFKDDIKVITHKINKGLAAARNTGIRQARGRYILNLDSDDYIHKEMLKLGSLFLDLNPDMDAIAFDYILVDDHESHLKHCKSKDEPIACGIFFRMEQLIDIGLYDEEFLAREEEDLKIRFEKKYKIYNVALPLYRYRLHENNLTSNDYVMEKYKKKINKKHF